MALDTYISFSYTDDASVLHTFDIRHPIRSYKTKIEMPIRFQKQDGAYYGSYDYGNGTEAYDIRSCVATFILDQTDATRLAPLWVDTTGRSRTWTMELFTNSGFYPFGADKGDRGIFSVAIIPHNTFQTGAAPLRWHRITLEIYNVGAYPAYSFLPDASEGRFNFGTVSNCRPPDAWFKPEYNFCSSTEIFPGGGVRYRNTGLLSDSKYTSFKFRGKDAKFQRVLQYITQTVRNNTFSISMPYGSYPFGLSVGNGPFNVRIIDGTINISHDQYHIFNMDMELEKRAA